MTDIEIKKKAEEACCEVVDFLRAYIHDEAKLNERYLELACSPEKSIDEIEKEVMNYVTDMYRMCMVSMIRYKSGDDSNVVRKFEDNN